MSITQKNQLAIAFKKLAGKSHRSPQLGISAEEVGTTIQLNTATIFADQIPADPSTLSMWQVDNTKAIQKVTFELTPLLQSQYAVNNVTNNSLSIDDDAEVNISSTFHAYSLKLSGSYETNTISVNGAAPFTKYGISPFANGFALTSSNGALQMVPPSFSPYYTAKVLGSDGSTIFESSEEDYYIDYFSGILFIQDPQPSRTPVKVEAFIYVGNYASEKSLTAGDNLVVQNQIVSLTSSITGGLDDVKVNNFLSASQITGSDALFQNLTVQGTLTTIDTQNLTIKDQLIEMNTGAGASNEGAGLYISGNVQDISLTVINNGSGMELNTYFSSSGQQTTYLSASTVEVTNNLSASIVTASYFSGSGQNLTNLTIGNAEDNNYTDGLFTDFVPSTYVGTAIDRINAVLKGVAPSKAPDLSNLESTTAANSPAMKLSFDSTNNVNSYAPVTTSLGDNVRQPTVAFNGIYSPATGIGTSPVRLGVYHTPTILSMSLNNYVAANQGVYVNYRAKSFNVSSDGVGTYAVLMNGLPLTPLNATNTNSYNQNNFVLSEAYTGSFIVSGQGFDLFRHRTGSVGIGTSLWQAGHNIVRVVHQIGAVQYLTNYVDWVYDPSAKPQGQGAFDYSFSSGPATGSSTFDSVNIKYLSGVKYYNTASYYYNATIQNLYRNTFANGANAGLSFPSTTGVSPSSITDAGTPATANSSYTLSNYHVIPAGTRLLGTSASSTLRISNGIGKTLDTTLSTATMLFDSLNIANTDTIENFCLEDKRIVSASYDNQTAVSFTWNSQTQFTVSDPNLAVYGGSVIHPTKILNNGNVQGSTVVHKLPSQPNYSTYTNNRTYFRAFRAGSSYVASGQMKITYTSTTFVASNGTLTGNNVKVSIKNPFNTSAGKGTGWRDPFTQKPSSYVMLDDGVGMATGTISDAGGIYTVNLDFGNEGVIGSGTPGVPGDYFLVRIEASSGWTGNISKIEFIIPS